MLLAIDIGNSNITFGIFSGELLVTHWSLALDQERSSQEYKAAVASTLESKGLRPHDINDIAVASVVTHLSAIFSQLLQELVGKQPAFITFRTISGLKIRYYRPETVGIDRLLGAVAAYETFGGPLIVADIGTAITLDAISKQGEFLGGIITPGPKICAEALYEKTDLLPLVQPEFPTGLIGRSTEDCIKSGVVNGAVELIDGLVRRMEMEMGEAVRVVATGGFADLISQRSETIKVVDPHLVLRGLQIVSKKAKIEEKRRMASKKRDFG